MDLVLLIFLPILASAISFVFHLGFLASTFLFFGVPAMFLSIKNPKLIAKSLFFALFVTLTMSWAMDFMGYFGGGWFTPSNFPRLLASTVAVEDIAWGFLWSYFGVIFWEYFLDHDKNKQKLSPLFRYLALLLGVQLLAFFSLYIGKSTWLIQPYFYLKFGLVLIIPMVVFSLLRFPKLGRKILAIACYFLFVSVLVEYTGLALGHWTFPGHYFIASWQLAGQTLPLEEIVFWWILGVPGIICWYEVFADDRK